MDGGVVIQRGQIRPQGVQKSAVSGQTITSGLAQSSDMIGVDRRVSTAPEAESLG